MIRSDSERRQAYARLRRERRRLEEAKTSLRRSGLAARELERICTPWEAQQRRLEQEIARYDRWCRAVFDPVDRLEDVGRLLIGLRIASGLSQGQLARALGVHVSQVSRDERDGYRNVGLQRAGHVVDALGARLRTTVESIGSERPQSSKQSSKE